MGDFICHVSNVGQDIVPEGEVATPVAFTLIVTLFLVQVVARSHERKRRLNFLDTFGS
jgi:hypothetical protein